MNTAHRRMEIISILSVKRAYNGKGACVGIGRYNTHDTP